MRHLQRPGRDRNRLTVPRIALDAMGGDRAPDEIVAGAVIAAERGVDVVLVGDREVVESNLEHSGVELPVVHAPDVIGMGDDPARSIREKPDSSIVRCARLVHDGDVAGFVSAGSTGAAMACAAIIVGRLPGVQRPTIASVVPGVPTPTVVLDTGANPEVKADHLVQFAHMGAALAEMLTTRRPVRVGLLSNGEERGKGRNLEKAAHDLLERAIPGFVGNVEGRDIASDRADVIVTDGFVGNVLLKTIEGAASLIQAMMGAAVSGLATDVRSQLAHALAPVVERMDYEATGGAHLLGVDGVVVIAHGSSSRKAVANALVMASDAAEAELVSRVAQGIAG